MNNQFIFKEFEAIPLTKDLADKYSAAICTALALIPSVEPRTQEQLLAETKGERLLYKKWEHSLIALKEDQFAGVIIGYERASENNDQYPHHSIYVSDFAVAEQFQRRGLGTFLVRAWLDYNQQKGFLALDGDLRFSIQTNSADWNKHVQALYESFGFRKIATKAYDNRVDNVYFLKA